MQYMRGLPIVPLADVGSSDVAIGDVSAASQLAAEETGWPETLLPAPRTWRVQAPSGDVRIIWGMPFLEAVTPGPAAALDNSEIVEARIASAGIQSIQHISGYGYLQPVGTLDAPGMSAAATSVPGVELAAGEVVLVDDELMWHDGTALVRERPDTHATGTPVRRVKAQASLALAVSRIAKRAADARNRAGASRRRDGSEVTFRVLDDDSRRALAQFKRPQAWLQALPAADVSGGTISDGGRGGGASIEDLLAAIRAGANITIGRGDPSIITVNAPAVAGGGQVASYFGVRSTYDEATNIINVVVDALPGEALPQASVLYLVAPAALPRNTEFVRMTVNGLGDHELVSLLGNPLRTRDITPSMFLQLMFTFRNVYVAVEPLMRRVQDYRLAVGWVHLSRTPPLQVEIDNMLGLLVSRFDNTDLNAPVYPTDPNTRDYLWMGVPLNAPDIIALEVAGQRDFTTTPIDTSVLGDPMFNGEQYKWWRTTQTVAFTTSGYSYTIKYAPYPV